MTTFRFEEVVMQYGCGLLVVILVIVLALGKCQQSQDAAELNEMMAEMERDARGFDSPTLPPTDEGEPFHVESDPRASYRLLQWSPVSGGYIEAVTRRDGPSGTSFTRTQINCAERLYRVRGEGDTEDEARRDSPNPGDWAELVPGSIKDVTVSVVCRKARA